MIRKTTGACLLLLALPFASAMAQTPDSLPPAPIPQEQVAPDEAATTVADSTVPASAKSVRRPSEDVENDRLPTKSLCAIA